MNPHDDSTSNVDSTSPRYNTICIILLTIHPLINIYQSQKMASVLSGTPVLILPYCTVAITRTELSGLMLSVVLCPGASIGSTSSGSGLQLGYSLKFRPIDWWS